MSNQNFDVKIERLTDCEWDSEDLFPDSPCHNSPSHIDRVSGLVFCHVHADAFESFAKAVRAEHEAKFAEAECGSEERTGPKVVSGAAASDDPLASFD